MTYKSVEGLLLEFVVMGVSLRCTTSNAASSYNAETHRKHRLRVNCGLRSLLGGR
jgi:hypothetical protein